MSLFFEGVDLTPVGGDNLPQITITNVLETKVSMMMLDLYYSGGLGRYLKHSHEDILLPCHVPMTKDGKKGPFKKFAIANGTKFFVFSDFTGYRIDPDPRYAPMIVPRENFLRPDVAECDLSLFGLLQTCPAVVDYHGLEETLHFFKARCSTFGPFHVGDRFAVRRFPELRPVEKPEGISLEQAFQNVLYSFLVRGFPDPTNTICEAPESKLFIGAIDFCNEYGIVNMKVVSFLHFQDGTLYIGHVPVTYWCVKNGELKKRPSCPPGKIVEGYPITPRHSTNYLVPIAMPGKQPLLHLDRIADADVVVICATPENAVALQKANSNKSVVFTGFVCDPGQYKEIDWSPLKDKSMKDNSVWIEIANHNGLTLAEAYTDASGLCEYLKNVVKLEKIHFLQRAIAYPPMDGVRNVDDLVRANRANPPHVIDGSILELNEDEFPAMVEKAQAEIARKTTAMNDVPFWNVELQVEAGPVENDKPVGRVTDKMILRPFIVAGTTTLISGAPGVGKSCIKTAICASIAGSPRKFLEGKFWTRCTPTDGHQYKVVDLVFDSDGAEAIADHRRDFASDIGENAVNYIQKDMSGDTMNYMEPENYTAFEKVLDNIEAHEGVPGQRIDVLCIDTLLAFSHEARELRKVNEVFKRLNHDRPDMATILIHHLNPRDKQAIGGVRVLTGVRAHVMINRTDEQMKAIPKGRLPLLSDPFTVSFGKASNIKIAEDGETFTVRLEEGNVFAVADKEDQETVRARRKAIVEGYAKQGLTQPEIARLFGVTDKTIRNWISKSE
jgi:hypothetical protein